MSRQRRQREVESAPASTIAFWTLALHGVFVLVFLGVIAGFAYLVGVGWWSSPLDVGVAVILSAAALVGLAFVVDGIRRDLRAAGWSARGELRELGRRLRRRRGGREQFAAQRFTGNARRRR